MLRFRHLLFVALGISAASTVSCTAIFAPRDDVQRCGSSDDCAPTGDTRYTAECRFDPAEVDLDTTKYKKICVATYNAPPCDKTKLGEFQGTYDDFTTKNPEHYDPTGATCADLGGVQGCPVGPMTGTCIDGLMTNEDGICDDMDPKTPKAYKLGVSQDPNLDFRGQDLLDQMCRSFFCDDRFVCDQTQNKCVICDPDLPLSQGGCGELYIAGAPSCVYEDKNELKNSCKAPNSNIAKPKLGSCD